MDDFEKIALVRTIEPKLNAVGLRCELSGVDIEDARYLVVWHPEFNREDSEQYVELSNLSSGKETAKTILYDLIVDLRNSAQNYD